MQSIAEFVGNYDSPRSIGSILRRRRSTLLVDLLGRIASETGRCSVLDVGGTEQFWNIVDRGVLLRMGCHITLLNLVPRTIRDERLFEHRVGDGTTIDVADNSFDVVHSNSVIEHVGGWRQMQMFSREVRRVAPRYLIQTPSFWFPWEPHFGTLFFHYLPRPLRVTLLMRKRRGFFARCSDLSSAVEAVESVRLLDAKMVQHLFPDARIVRERFCGLTKSYIAIRE